jgi:uncharacterized cupredoxin-like copper-binding protein
MQQQLQRIRTTPARLLLLVPVFALLPMLIGTTRPDATRHEQAQDTTTITIMSHGTDLAFHPAEISVKQGATVRIRYMNESRFAHNVVIVKKEAYIDTLGAAAHEASATGWMPMQHKDKTVAFSPLAAPGNTVEFTFVAPPAGEYPFVCLVDGHHNVMIGTLRSRS